MRILILVFLPMFFFLCPLWSQEDTPLSPGEYSGWLEDIYPVHFEFTRDSSGELAGMVHFPLTSDSLFVAVDVIDSRLMFTEFDENARIVGFYFLDKKEGFWEGSWRNSDGDVALKVYLKKGEGNTGKGHSVSAANNKWLEVYSIVGLPGENRLTVFRQSGWSISGTYTTGGDTSTRIFLRGECLDIDCRKLGLLSHLTTDDFYLELSRGGTDPGMTIFYPEKEEDFRIKREKEFGAHVIYGFNNFFVFDAVVPDFNPLVNSILEEQTARWMAESIRDLELGPSTGNNYLDEKFSHRNYIWTEIAEINDLFISGYMEWINDRESEKMKSFVYDLHKNQFFWDSDLSEMDLISPATAGDLNPKEGVFLVVKGGWQYISPLDPLSGRSYHYVDMENRIREIPRPFRKWFLN